MSPPPFKEIKEVVENYVTRGSKYAGWYLDTRHESDEDQLVVFPIVKPSYCAVKLHYVDTKNRVTVDTEYNSKKPFPWRDLLPTVKLQLPFHEARKIAQEVEVKLGGKTPVVSYSFSDPNFYITTRTRLTDGLMTAASLSSVLYTNVLGGFSFSYDPSRSGLRNMTVGAAFQNIPQLRNGDVYAQYDLIAGPGIHARVPIKPLCGATTILERNRVTVGVEGRSPCGAQMIAKVNLSQCSATLTAIRAINDIWKVTATSTFPVARGTDVRPTFGIVFSHN